MTIKPFKSLRDTGPSVLIPYDDAMLRMGFVRSVAAAKGVQPTWPTLAPGTGIEWDPNPKASCSTLVKPNILRNTSTLHLVQTRSWIPERQQSCCSLKAGLAIHMTVSVQVKKCGRVGYIAQSAQRADLGDNSLVASLGKTQSMLDYAKYQIKEKSLHWSQDKHDDAVSREHVLAGFIKDVTDNYISVNQDGSFVFTDLDEEKTAEFRRIQDGYLDWLTVALDIAGECENPVFILNNRHCKEDNCAISGSR